MFRKYCCSENIAVQETFLFDTFGLFFMQLDNMCWGTLRSMLHGVCVVGTLGRYLVLFHGFCVVGTVSRYLDLFHYYSVVGTVGLCLLMFHGSVSANVWSVFSFVSRLLRRETLGRSLDKLRGFCVFCSRKLK